MKRNTKNKARKTVPPAVRELVLCVAGAQAEIARLAGCRRSYVSEVMHGKKAPSSKLWAAMVAWIQTSKSNILRQMARAEMEGEQ